MSLIDDQDTVRTGTSGGFLAPLSKSNKLEVPAGYEVLGAILQEALNQSALGKGVERHRNHAGQAWHEQPILTIQHIVGSGFATGQALKKIDESMRMEKVAGRKELLGAIVYLAAAIHYEDTQSWV